jgi:hypothetical protein
LLPECERPSFRTYRIVVLSILNCIQAASDICTLFFSWKHILEYYSIWLSSNRLKCVI